MTSSLYFLPPTSSPPCWLISSKINSVAFLCGMPQGAAGPERGVETPNLMTSAAPAWPGLTATTMRARNANPIRGAERFIARSLLRFCTVPVGDGTIETAVTRVNPPPRPGRICPDDRAIFATRAQAVGRLIREASDGLREKLQIGAC